MEQTELLKQALKKIENIQYSSKDLAQQSQERIGVYNEFGIDPITSLAAEIVFLWEFIDMLDIADKFNKAEQKD